MQYMVRANKVIIRALCQRQGVAGLRTFHNRVDSHRVSPEVHHYLDLGFTSAARLFSDLTPARLVIMETLKQRGAQSMYALAKHLKRNYSNVHRDVQKLLEYELVTKDATGQIYVPWDQIEIQLSLGVSS
jgi:predicted transcriptional regulator